MTTPAKHLSAILNSHRSIRAFKPDLIDDAIVNEVIHEAVAGGSSSGNLNSISVVLTREAHNKRALYALHSNQPMVLQAPLLVTFCADFFRTRQWLKARRARDNFNNLIGYHVAAFDAMIVAQNACLGFEARGFGICYMGTTLHSMGEIASLLELPETCLPVTTLVVGVPDENPSKRDRLPTPSFIHRERYATPTQAEIDETYRARDVAGWNRYMSMPTLRAKIEEMGITSLAEFYTSDAKYPPDVFARDSAKLRATLESKQFL